MRSQQRNRTEPARIDRAFTLIELMVVVSIIAVLISILLPSLGAAREQAKIVKCAAQMRQLGLGTRYYSADNNGWIPGNYYPGGSDGSQETPHVLAAEVIARYLGGPPGPPPGTIGVSGVSRDCALAQMFVRMPIFQCPSWPGGTDGNPNGCPTSAGSGSRRRGGGNTPAAPSGPGPVEITQQVLTYSVNAWDWIEEKRNLAPDGYYNGIETNNAYGIRKIDRVLRPADILFMTESNRDNIGWQAFVWHDIFRKTHLWDSVDSRMVDDLRHRAGKGLGIDRAVNNNLYYDGHVATVRVVSISSADFSPYQRPEGAPAPTGGRGGTSRR